MSTTNYFTFFLGLGRWASFRMVSVVVSRLAAEAFPMREAGLTSKVLPHSHLIWIFFIVIFVFQFAFLFFFFLLLVVSRRLCFDMSRLIINMFHHQTFDTLPVAGHRLNTYSFH